MRMRMCMRSSLHIGHHLLELEVLSVGVPADELDVDVITTLELYKGLHIVH